MSWCCRSVSTGWEGVSARGRRQDSTLRCRGLPGWVPRTGEREYILSLPQRYEPTPKAKPLGAPLHLSFLPHRITGALTTALN